MLIEPYGLDGTSVGLTGTVPVPANGQSVVFLSQVPGLESLPTPFKGVVRVSSTTALAVAAIRAQLNARFELLFTGIPTVDETSSALTSDVFLPLLLEGGGWTTEFSVFSGTAGQTSSGVLSFTDPAGEPLELLLVD